MRSTTATGLLSVAALAVFLGTMALPVSRAQTAPTPTAVKVGATQLIDTHMTAMWRNAGVAPAPRSSDTEFLRRVTLDLVGRIPTPGEVAGFSSDRKPNKRLRMVDRLLASTDYAQHWADVYMDLLIGRQLRLNRRVGGARGYFVRTFATNKRFDSFVDELITASGDWQLQPASVYILSFYLQGKQVDQLAGTTAQLFLGQQIQCAQCHDHPYDKRYKQADFNSFAAYFGQLRRRAVRDPLFGNVLSVFDSDRFAPKAVRRINAFTLTKPRFLGDTAVAKPKGWYRTELSTKIRASPLFAMATVNRTWRLLFGRALSEPWNDLRSATDPKHPQLLRGLAGAFRRSGFDHKSLLKAIVLSAAYQRTSHNVSAKQRTVFAAANVRALSADQLYRSQLLATGISELVARSRGQARVPRFEQQFLRQYLFRFRDQGDQGDRAHNVPQALILRNNHVTNHGVRALPGSVLGRIFAASSVPEKRLEWMFMAAYGRRPRAAETTRYVTLLRRQGSTRDVYEDLFHAMLTSTEFVTNH